MTSYDISVLSNQIKSNINDVTTYNLINYLLLRSHNITTYYYNDVGNIITYDNNKTHTYLTTDEKGVKYINTLESIYEYNNIFYNTQTLVQQLIMFCFILIPYFISYPRFYTISIFMVLIIFVGIIMTFKYLINIYSFLLSPTYISFILFTLSNIIFYIFIKINIYHITIYGICFLIAFLILNYLFYIISFSVLNRDIDMLHVSHNIGIIEIDDIINETSNEIIKRLNVKNISSSQLYKYINTFDINISSNKINENNMLYVFELLSIIIQPIIFVLILLKLGHYFKLLGYSIQSQHIIFTLANYLIHSDKSIYIDKNLIENKVCLLIIQLSSSLIYFCRLFTTPWNMIRHILNVNMGGFMSTFVQLGSENINHKSNLSVLSLKFIGVVLLYLILIPIYLMIINMFMNIGKSYKFINLIVTIVTYIGLVFYMR